MESITDSYRAWQIEPTPERLGGILSALDPVLVQEIQNYPGPKPVLHVKAKRLALDAVKSYDPNKGANLRTWVTNQLKPLSRFGQAMTAVRPPEVARRRAAEVNRVYEEMHDRMGRYPHDDELSDELGISPAQLARLRSISGAGVSESQFSDTATGDQRDMPALSHSVSTDYAFDAVYMGLDPREKVIMDWKTGRHGKETLTNAEIAARLGVSPAFVSQVSSDIAKRVGRVIQDGL